MKSPLKICPPASRQDIYFLLGALNVIVLFSIRDFCFNNSLED
jgi:hypothetical protein